MCRKPKSKVGGRRQHSSGSGRTFSFFVLTLFVKDQSFDYDQQRVLVGGQFSRHLDQ